MSGSEERPEPVPDRAGEYVLGVMRGEERRAFEEEMARDPALAAEVAAWERRLLPLALAVPPAAPPAPAWDHIASAIGFPASAALARPSHGMRLWRSLTLWRGFAVIAAAAALALAVLRPHPVPGPDLVAVLQPSALAPPVPPGVSPAAFAVAVHPDGAIGVTPVSTRRPPEGRVWQLWAIAPGKKPVPIGLLRASRPTRLGPGDVPATLRHADIQIAVSVEPPGGSPTGQPTGPVVFAGPLLKLR